MQDEIDSALIAMRKALVIRNYSARTVETYVYVLKRYLEELEKAIDDIRPEDIQAWQYILVSERNISSSFINQTVCALRFFFRDVRKCTWPVVQIPLQRKHRRLPIVLNRDEVARLLAAIKHNIKHHAIIATLYSTGLRLGELVMLRIGDIDSRDMVVHVRQGKGGKDRNVQLSQRLLVILRDYYRSCLVKPSTWLFPGAMADKPMNPSGIQKMITIAALKARIDKNVSPHTLRHCFATHLLEEHTDLRTIQSMLGHESIATTEIYLHVATKHLKNVRNPLDFLPAVPKKKRGA
jgi:site-specific recombinase XerD